MVERFPDETTIPQILKVGLDYPGLYREFVDWFSDEEACLTYVEKLRWPNGFTCPACDLSVKLWRQTRGSKGSIDID